jgi:hypothetical protein
MLVGGQIKGKKQKFDPKGTFKEIKCSIPAANLCLMFYFLPYRRFS